MLKISNQGKWPYCREEWEEQRGETQLSTWVLLSRKCINNLSFLSPPTQVNVLIYLELIDPKLWTLKVTEEQVPHSGGRARMEDREQVNEFIAHALRKWPVYQLHMQDTLMCTVEAFEKYI